MDVRGPYCISSMAARMARYLGVSEAYAGEILMDYVCNEGEGIAPGVLRVVAKSDGRAWDIDLDAYRAIPEAQVPYPEDVVEARKVCAERFAGYDYEDAEGIGVSFMRGVGLRRLARPVVDACCPYPEREKNFAAYYEIAQQATRGAGRYRDHDAPLHVAYDFLFLALCREEVPEEFRNAEQMERWEREFAGRVDALAAVVEGSRADWRVEGSGWARRPLAGGADGGDHPPTDSGISEETG